jgi:hypothetical protein
VKEPASAYSAQGPLMVGPDGAAYVIAKHGHAATQAVRPAGWPESLGVPVVQGIRVRHGLRRKLRHLPQMGNVGPC